jgi:hypothetical protein
MFRYVIWLPVLIHMTGFVLSMYMGIFVLAKGYLKWPFGRMSRFRGPKAAVVGIALILLSMSCLCYMTLCCHWFL